MKLLVLFYSSYGHVHRMAQAVAEGARQVSETEVEIMRVPETLSPNMIQAMRWKVPRGLRQAGC